MNPRPPRKARAVRVEDELWTAALRRTEERGDVLSEEIRTFLKRYIRSSKVNIYTNDDVQAAMKDALRAQGIALPAELVKDVLDAVAPAIAARALREVATPIIDYCESHDALGVDREWVERLRTRADEIEAISDPAPAS